PECERLDDERRLEARSDPGRLDARDGHVRRAGRVQGRQERRARRGQSPERDVQPVGHPPRLRRSDKAGSREAPARDRAPQEAAREEVTYFATQAPGRTINFAVCSAGGSRASGGAPAAHAVARRKSAPSLRIDATPWPSAVTKIRPFPYE